MADIIFPHFRGLRKGTASSDWSKKYFFLEVLRLNFNFGNKNLVKKKVDFRRSSTLSKHKSNANNMQNTEIQKGM